MCGTIKTKIDISKLNFMQATYSSSGGFRAEASEKLLTLN